jgi:flavin reductase (DIM6/NTAB) family NADH-FMN oxidoreductase RutF
MAKLQWKPGTLLYPVPVVLVTCGDIQGVKNMITIAWAGTVASDPVMVSISVRPERYSHGLIKESGEFVINLPNRHMVRAVDYCGVVSGKDYDKFQATGLTPVPAKNVKTPIILEAPLALECQVTSLISLGSHDLFLAKVLGVQVDEHLVDQTGKLNLAKAELISYVHGHYRTLKEAIGSFGFSVKKHNRRKS